MGCAFVVSANDGILTCDEPSIGAELWQGNRDLIVAVPLCAEHRELSAKHVVPARTAAAGTLQLRLPEEAA